MKAELDIGFLYYSSKPRGNQEPRGFLRTRNTDSIQDSKKEKDFAGYFGDNQDLTLLETFLLSQLQTVLFLHLHCYSVSQTLESFLQCIHNSFKLFIDHPTCHHHLPRLPTSSPLNQNVNSLQARTELGVWLYPWCLEQHLHIIVNSQQLSDECMHACMHTCKNE